MEPVTHALTSLALARTGKKHLPRFGTAMLVVAGLAPDLDYASYLGGAGTFLRFDRTLFHSLTSCFVLAAAVAGGFYVFEAAQRKKPSHAGDRPEERSAGFGVAFLVCLVGVATHLLLDVASGVGVQLLWPFRTRWFAWDLLRDFDLWILLILAGGLLLPMLVALVSEEIGERKKTRGRGAARTALVVLAAYVGARGLLQGHAVSLLESQDYHGRTPLSAGAFPSSASPLDWRGVVGTENTIEELDVSFAAGREFDPERSATQYKPDDSPALRAGQRSAAAQLFLKYARFPLARVVKLGDGYQFELRDERFEANDGSPANIRVLVEMSENYQIKSEEFSFASSR